MTKKVVVYGSSSCPYCDAARMLLNQKAVVFEYIAITNDPLRRQEMQKRSGRQTIPQIFIGNTSIGGFEELLALDKSGELNKLLAG
ncbi:MAG: glutaredoxin 3 [Woeseiaceae bacterium]|nr:glutaredoxin 3 [Woeseiaceae bacterium]